MAHIGWGSLADSESYGTLGDNLDDYKSISIEASTSKQYSNYKAAAHGMIFARKTHKLWDLYEQKALVMMTLRFDGVFGFAGGLVDEGESASNGLNREMSEEIGLDLNKYSFNTGHQIAAYVHEEKRLVLHFYLMEVSIDDFVTLEKKALTAEEYGIETFGSIRVPLHTMGDGLRGFPAFLANEFAGNARAELIKGLLVAGIFTKQEMTEALNACEKFKKIK